MAHVPRLQPQSKLLAKLLRKVGKSCLSNPCVPTSSSKLIVML